MTGRRHLRTLLPPRFPAKFRAQILATPGPTTLQGSHLDFILASTSIASALRLEADWEVPWKPHCALALQFDCAQAAVPVQQLQRFPPITRNYHPKHLWTSFNEEDGPFHIIGQNITGLGSDFARWATQTEKYLTQHLHKPVTGRGSQVRLHQAPLASSTKPRVWKKGSAVFWEKTGIKINLANHGRYPGLLQDLKDMVTRIPQHASKEMDQNSFEERLLQWVFGGNPDPEDLLHTVQQELQHAQEQPPIMNSGNGWRRLTTKAYGDSFVACGRKIMLRNGPSKICLPPPASKPEQNSGETSGSLLRNLCRYEAFRS